MPITTTTTRYTHEEKRDIAFNRWLYVSQNHDKWTAEAEANEDYEMQARLRYNVDFQPDHLWKMYLLYTSQQLSEQARKAVYADHETVHPDARERAALLDSVMFILERGTTKHIERADNALRSLFEEVDLYVSPEEMEQAIAEAKRELNERDEAIEELETMLSTCEAEPPSETPMA